MEASKISTDVPAIIDPQASPDPNEVRETVLKFSSSFKDRAPTAERGDSPKRDWSSAIDLVNEAFEAIRLADERAVAAENYHQQLVQHHKEQVKTMESRIAVSEKRAEVAEQRAKDAESWLARFHDTIVDGFQRTFTVK